MHNGNAAPWDVFNRFTAGGEDFFGIVREDGTWEDSAISFASAIHFCAMADGRRTECDMLEDIAHLNRSKWSIVHSSMLRKMYEAGLIK